MVTQQNQTHLLPLKYALEFYSAKLWHSGKGIGYIWFVLEGCLNIWKRKVYTIVWKQHRLKKEL